MPETFMKDGLEIFKAACIVVVKKTFRLADLFFLQPFIPQFHISEHNFGKRYNHTIKIV